MITLYRRLVQNSHRHHLLSHYSTKPNWPRPSNIPFQAKVSNSVDLIGYVHSPIRHHSSPDGSSWSSIVLTSHSLDDSSDSLRVPVIFEGDLAHIAISHLKENDCVYINGRLGAGLPHLSGTQVEASVQVVANDISFVKKDVQKKKFSDSFIQSGRENFNSSNSVSKQGNLGLDPWKDLFDNPKEWWDNRDAKLNGSVGKKYPDFKRKDDSKESESDTWKDLVDNSKEWCDYRSSKLQGLVNSKYPDFKRKDGSSALWLGRAPRWLYEKLGGLEFHVQTPKSKAPKDDGKRDELWKNLVENPDKWWDNRLNKTKQRSPDFKHKETGEALWLSDSPNWVSLKLPPPKSKGNAVKRDTLLS